MYINSNCNVLGIAERSSLLYSDQILAAKSWGYLINLRNNWVHRDTAATVLKSWPDQIKKKRIWHMLDEVVLNMVMLKESEKLGKIKELTEIKNPWNLLVREMAIIFERVFFFFWKKTKIKIINSRWKIRGSKLQRGYEKCPESFCLFFFFLFFFTEAPELFERLLDSKRIWGTKWLPNPGQKIKASVN